MKAINVNVRKSLSSVPGPRAVLAGRWLAAIGASCLMASTAAQAYVVNVGGSAYDILTVTGTFADNQTLFTSQPWYGNQSLASAFATALNDHLGLDIVFSDPGTFTINASPLFAWNDNALGSNAGNFGSQVWSVYTNINPQYQQIFPNLNLNPGVGSIIGGQGQDYRFAYVLPAATPPAEPPAVPEAPSIALVSAALACLAWVRRSARRVPAGLKRSPT